MSAQTTRRPSRWRPPDKRTLRREWTALIAGIIIALVAVSPPVDERSIRPSPHMVQHMVMIVVVAPLLAIAWPLILALADHALRCPAQPAGAAGAGVGPLAVDRSALVLAHPDAVRRCAGERARAHTAAFDLHRRVRPVLAAVDQRSAGRRSPAEQRARALPLHRHGCPRPAGAYITFSGELLYPHYADTTPGGRTPGRPTPRRRNHVDRRAAGHGGGGAGHSARGKLTAQGSRRPSTNSGRTGRFSPACVVWARRVWTGLPPEEVRRAMKSPGYRTTPRQRACRGFERTGGFSPACAVWARLVFGQGCRWGAHRAMKSPGYGTAPRKRGLSWFGTNEWVFPGVRCVGAARVWTGLPLGMPTGR
ncbi:MAG: cytochrome c oxidase assembly protein [Anaerolineae bacterium]|nr:MAG: cytochrome c oxidase assembly protein [Anaerolineae bacterium]